MRIAIDARAAAEVRAGRGRYFRELLEALAGLDADHEYLLYARTAWPSERLDPRFRWRLVSARGLRWPLAAGRAMSRSADVAFACSSYAVTAPWRIPGAALVHDLAAFDRRWQTPRASAFERLTLPIAVRRCGALVAISQATRSELGERYPQALPKTVVAHAAAAARFSALAGADDEDVLARHGLTRPYLLVTGTVEPRKNLPRLIEAFAGLEEPARRGWTLALAGAPGWQTDASFAAVAAQAGLVRTLGFVPDEDLPALYREAEVFCYPSLYEGFGIPVLEAMASGTAVLTSSVSSMPEVGGDAARYANPNDIEDIRRALRELLGDAQLRRRCAAAGLERAASFSWSAAARVVLTTLEGLAR